MNENSVLSETDFLEPVWDHNYAGFSNVASVYIGYLRRKNSLSNRSGFRV